MQISYGRELLCSMTGLTPEPREILTTGQLLIFYWEKKKRKLITSLFWAWFLLSSFYHLWTVASSLPKIMQICSLQTAASAHHLFHYLSFY